MVGITAARGAALMETQLITLQPNRKPIHMCINEFHIHCTLCEIGSYKGTLVLSFLAKTESQS